MSHVHKDLALHSLYDGFSPEFIVNQVQYSLNSSLISKGEVPFEHSQMAVITPGRMTNNDEAMCRQGVCQVGFLE